MPAPTAFCSMVPQTRQPIPLDPEQQKGPIPPVQGVPEPSAGGVEGPAVSLVYVFHESRNRCFALRCGDQVDVIGHQHIGMDRRVVPLCGIPH